MPFKRATNCAITPYCFYAIVYLELPKKICYAKIFREKERQVSCFPKQGSQNLFRAPAKILLAKDLWEKEPQRSAIAVCALRERLKAQFAATWWSSGDLHPGLTTFGRAFYILSLPTNLSAPYAGKRAICTGKPQSSLTGRGYAAVKVPPD